MRKLLWGLVPLCLLFALMLTTIFAMPASAYSSWNGQGSGQDNPCRLPNPPSYCQHGSGHDQGNQDGNHQGNDNGNGWHNGNGQQNGDFFRPRPPVYCFDRGGHRYPQGDWHCRPQPVLFCIYRGHRYPITSWECRNHFGR